MNIYLVKILQSKLKYTLYKVMIIGCFIFPTTSFGQWQMISTEDTLFNYNDVTVTADSTIFICGYDYYAAGIILKSIDFGTSWTSYTFPGRCFDITFPTNSIGYALVYPSSVYKTIDNGDTWTLIVDTLDINKPANDILFINADTGFVSAQDNGASFYRTLDGGITWEQFVDSSLGVNFQYIGGRQISFDDKKVYVTGGNCILRSYDYGENWIPRYNTSIYTSNFTVAAKGNNKIWMAGMAFNGVPHYNYGVISRTFNGGISWVVLKFQQIFRFNDIEMLDSLNGYLIGDFYDSSYAFLKTNNGGASWYTQQWTGSNPYGFGLNSMYCLNDSTCFAVGSNATIFRITTGGGPLTSLIEPSVIKESSILYPNPVKENQSLFFKGDILELNAIDVKLMNVIGQYVLVRANINPKVGLDLTGVKQGVYLMQVSSGNEVRSMMKVVVE